MLAGRWRCPRSKRFKGCPGCATSAGDGREFRIFVVEKRNNMKAVISILALLYAMMFDKSLVEMAD